MPTKYIFVTGGVVSGLGKGITAASLGRLLKARGLRVTMQKFDPYLNIDPGTMNPVQHGEVFVTDDGAETDLDLGHYERFIDESLTQNSNVTSGRVYWNVITRERQGDFGGGTVQVIPHITNEIKSRISAGKENVDIAIIEAGIGGQLDSTNVLSPELVICTSISFDHTETLGDSLIDIARHKAGVMRENTPILLGRVSEEVSHLFKQKSQELQAPIANIDREIQLLSTDNQTLRVIYSDWESPDLNLPMLGKHQENNTGLAVTAAHLLTQRFPKITNQSIQDGICDTHWPGRSEWIGNNIYLDGAHNPQGIASLKQVLKDNFSNRRIHILFAGLRRKPLTDLLDELKEYHITVTSFNFFEALPLDDYPQHLERSTDYRDWLTQSESANSDNLFVVTGSLYFISEVRNYLINEKKA